MMSIQMNYNIWIDWTFVAVFSPVDITMKNKFMLELNINKY